MDTKTLCSDPNVNITATDEDKVVKIEYTFKRDDSVSMSHICTVKTVASRRYDEQYEQYLEAYQTSVFDVLQADGSVKHEVLQPELPPIFVRRVVWHGYLQYLAFNSPLVEVVKYLMQSEGRPKPPIFVLDTNVIEQLEDYKEPEFVPLEILTETVYELAPLLR